MTEGTKTEDIQDLTPASIEITEARSALDKATLEPEAALERSDFKLDEAVQAAFTDVVQVTTATDIHTAEATTFPPEASPPSEGILPSAPVSKPDSSLRPTDSEALENQTSTASRGGFSATLTTAQKISTTYGEGDSERLTTTGDVPLSSNVPSNGASDEEDVPVGDSQGSSVTANSEGIAIEKGAEEIGNSLAVDTSYVPPLTPDVQAYDSPPPSGAEDASQKVIETAQKAEIETSSQTGKADFGDPATESAQYYSGVEMTQGEVQEDNDLNNPPSGEATDSTSQQATREAQNQDVPQEELQDSMSDVQAAQEIASTTTDHDSDQQTDSELTESSTLENLSNQLQAMDESNEALRNQSATLEEQIDQQGESAASGPRSEAADQNMTEKEDLPAYDRDLIPEKAAGDQVIDSSENSLTPQSVVSSGEDLRSTEEVIKEFEEKLNEMGDDAELADIDLQAMLDKQQEDIAAMSRRAEDLHDLAMVAIRKMGLTQPSNEEKETGKKEANQPEDDLPSTTINFTDLTNQMRTVDSNNPISEILKVDPLPEQTAGGDEHQIPVDSVDLNLSEKEDPPAYDPDLKPEKIEEAGTSTGSSNIDYLVGIATRMAEDAAKEGVNMAAEQTEMQENKESIREDQQNLEDELSDWPDGETREITITTWEEGEDGTPVKMEKTVTLTKEEAEDLLDQMDEGTEDIEERGAPFQLEEGSLIVGESLVAELAPNGSEHQDDQGIEREDSGLSSKEFNENTEIIANYKQTLDSISEQISFLEDLQQDLTGSQQTVSVVLMIPEKQSDGTYNMVPETTPVSESSIPQIIAVMELIADVINWEVRNLGAEISNSDTLFMLQDFEDSLQNIQGRKADEVTENNQAVDDAKNN